MPELIQTLALTYIFLLRTERKNLQLELNLLNNELSNAYANSSDVVNAKLRILTRLKKQSEKKDNEFETLSNFILSKFGDKTTVSACKDKGAMCIAVLNEVLEKIELQNFYLDNQFKENITPNVKIVNKGRKKIRAKSPLPSYK